MKSANLERLLAESARGNQAAFAALYVATAPRLLAIAFRTLHDRQRAEDVLQQTMLSIWQTASDFDPALGTAGAWMGTLTRNRAIDEYRREKRRRLALAPERHAARADPLEFAEVMMPDPVSRAAAGRINDCLHAMGKLPARSIRLAYVDGMTCNEISVRLDVPIGTVKSWLRRGMRQLRESVSR